MLAIKASDPSPGTTPTNRKTGNIATTSPNIPTINFITW
jgi:hypothetical protein